MSTRVIPRDKLPELPATARVLTFLGIGSSGRLSKARNLVLSACQFVDLAAPAKIKDADARLKRAVELLFGRSDIGAVGEQILNCAMMERLHLLLEIKKDTVRALEQFESIRSRCSDLLDLTPAVAGYLAQNEDANPQSIALYIEVIKSLVARSRQQITPDARLVFSGLEKLCSIDDTTALELITKKLELCDRVLDADPRLIWAFYYRGIGNLRLKRPVQAHQAFKDAERLGCKRPLQVYYVHYSAGMQIIAADGDRAAALTELRLARTASPTRGECCLLLATLLVDFASNSAEVSNRHSLAREAIEALTRITPPPSEQTVQDMLIGKAHLVLGEPPSASQAFDRVTQLDASCREAWLLLAQSLNDIGAPEYARAEQAARQALALSRSIDAHRELGRALYGQCRYIDAVTELSCVHAELPNDREIVLLLARAFLGSGNIEDSCRVLEPVKQDLECGLLHAYGLIELGKYDELESSLASLQTLYPSSCEIHYYYGVYHSHVGQLSTSIDCLTRSITVNPNYAPAYHLRAGAFARCSMYQESRIDYEAALALNADGRSFPSEDVVVQLAAVCRCTGDLDVALTALSSPAMSTPPSCKVRLARGMVLEQKGDYAAAQALYENVTAEAPENSEAQRRLGVMLWRLCARAEAAASFSRAYTLGDRSSELLYFLGLAASENSDYDNAIQYWSELAASHPEDKKLELNVNRLHYMRARQRLPKHDYAGAIQDWNVYLKLRPDDAAIRTELGSIYLEYGLHQLLTSQDAVGAREAFESAGALNAQIGSAALLCSALCDFASGDYQSFISCAEPIIETLLSVARPVALYHLGAARMLTGDPIRGKELLSEAQSEAHTLGVHLDFSLPVALLEAQNGNWTEAAAAISGVSIQ